MPSWQPNWQDVLWNYGAAETAASALRRVADVLDQTADERARVADEARAEWRGRYRDEFDAKFTQMLRRAHELAGEYRAAANRILGANQRAREEQMRRERDRERWRLEKEAEDRARQQQAHSR